MSTEVLDRVINVENRVSKLEDIEIKNAETFEKIEKSLKTIEVLLVGEPNLNSVGLISTIRGYEKQIAELNLKLSNFEANFNKLSEEYKKYKWYLKGSIATILGIIGYGLEIWKLFPGV